MKHHHSCGGHWDISHRLYVVTLVFHIHKFNNIVNIYERLRMFCGQLLA